MYANNYLFTKLWQLWYFQKFRPFWAKYGSFSLWNLNNTARDMWTNICWHRLYLYLCLFQFLEGTPNYSTLKSSVYKCLILVDGTIKKKSSNTTLSNLFFKSKKWTEIIMNVSPKNITLNGNKILPKVKEHWRWFLISYQGKSYYYVTHIFSIAKKLRLKKHPQLLNVTGIE